MLMAIVRCKNALATSARFHLNLVAPAVRLGMRLNSTMPRELPPHQGASQPSSSRPSQPPNAPRNGGSPSPTEEDEEKKKLLQKPRNEAIKFRYVRLVNPETKSLEPPTLLHNIISTLDRKTQYLELVTKEPEPIVKIINTKALYARGKAKKERHLHNRPPEEKELQLTWGVAMGDLQFKLNKAREDLLDGNRVTIIFATKKGQKVPSPQDQQAMIEEAVRLLEDVGRERKEKAAQKHMTALFLESLRPRKQTHELDWAYTGDEPWEGLKAVESALSKGARVEVTLHTPPPPKKSKEAQDLPPDPKAVDPAEVKRRLDETVARLTKLGNEWKPRDTRKTAVILYLEGIRTT